MRKIYLFPTECEASPFRHLAPEAEIVISGVGMAAVAASVVASVVADGDMCDTLIILAGVAGAYGDMAVCSVCEVESECCVELPECFREHHRATYCTAQLPTVASNTVHRTGAEAAGADIENMEGAALFAMAEVANIGVTQIRGISNRVGEPFERWRFREAVEALATA